MTTEQAAARVQRYFVPYHQQLAYQLGRIKSWGLMAFCVVCASFTPVFKGFVRPLHLGVLSELDDDIQASGLVETLRQQTNYHIGINQPYNAKRPFGYTIHHHAVENNYPHLLIEICQHLIESDSQQEAMTSTLCTAIRPVVEDLLGATY